MGGLAFRVHRRRVAWKDVVPEHAVGMVHGVEVIAVERQQHTLVVGIVDGVLNELAVRVVDDHRANGAGANIGGIEDRFSPLVAASKALRALLDVDDETGGAETDAAIVVVGRARDK